MEVVRLEDVWKAYRGNEYVLRGVNLVVNRGDLIAITGKSGVGKTTLLKLIGLLDKPSRGDVVIFGRSVGTLSDREASLMRLNRIGFIFQSFNLIPHLTVLENLEVPMYMRGVPRGVRRVLALNLLREFGLERLADRYPHEISMGEQQRVAALRAVVNKPELILADEPTAHLDDENSQLLYDMLRRFNREFKSTIVISAISPDDVRIAGKTYVLINGILKHL